MIEHALIVDDHPKIAHQMAEILKSLGHTCDIALTQAEALRLFENPKITYVVTDLHIPVEKHGLSRRENGLNLVSRIAKKRASPDIFVVVVTSHADDGGHRLAVQTMQCEAADYISKDEMLSGPRSLDRVVEALIAKRKSGAKPRGCKQPDSEPRQFVSGVLDFYVRQIDLEGVKIIGNRRDVVMRSVFDDLGRHKRDAKRSGIDGETLGLNAKVPRGQNSIANSISKFKPRLASLMLKEANLKLEPNDVIENDRKIGYRLSDKIEVRFHESNGPVGGTVNPTGVTVDGTVPDDPEVGARWQWIRQEIAKRGSVRLRDIVAKFKCSERTAKRDFEALGNEIAFVGSPKKGAYRFKAAPALS